jgi:uncharacterized protein YdaU (DUF1376 family)
MPLYIGDYLADTMHLSTEQHGAYLLLLFHLWRRGVLQDDDAVLAQITGLPISAWTVSRAVLAEFFEIHDGQWHHGRVEREKSRTAAKQKLNANRAKLGASTRWGKSRPVLEEAESLSASNASSILNGMLGDAKSQSQPQLLKTLPSSSSVSEKRAVDERHVPFRLILGEYWSAKNHASPEMPWQGRDAKALSDFLAASPNLSEIQFRKMLENRAKSAVAHGDRVFLWIANLSGTVAAFTSVSVDVPGYELYMANIPVGPSNTLNRTIGFTVADGTNAGPFFYIPSATVSASIPMTATVIADNTTTTAFFNFTDAFLEAETSTNMTDRLRCILPPAAVDVYYSPSNDRVVLSGVDGYGSGHYISLAADSESYYGDTSPIQVGNGNGQRCICAREFQGTLFSLKERSGFTISPTATDPSTWSVQQRWEGVGPCGPRAVCVTNEFLFFVHRSGAYAYSPSEAQPKLMTKEIPTLWQTINWDYQHLIWCCVDEENKEIRIGVPIGNATTPNKTLTMNYMEGLSGPIHFSQYAGREVAMGAARKWSLDDIAGLVAVRCERELRENASPFGALRQSQVLIGSSSPDGTVQMIATGIYNDNGAGIACQYETTSTQDLMDVSMLGGVSINALGQGSMTVSVMVARTYEDSQQSSSSNGTNEIKLAPFPLTPENWGGYDGGARGQNERFRMRFTNGAIANAWFALKYCSLFTRPLFSGRSGDGA